MVRSWLIDGRGFAKKVKNACDFTSDQIKDCGANRQCPNCRHCIDNSDVSHDWPGLPPGVKFDPSDVELLQHLAAKCGVGNSEPHMFIDEFIPTLKGDEGICYTHPENLPGAKKDGSSVHFFYKITNAYATGQRKRRRIEDKTHVRWHKTGKTKPITENGIQKGCKKIMVLYETLKRGSKPDKCNWVMHQYHLGSEEAEIEGEYVVSKIFHQPQKEMISTIIIHDHKNEYSTTTNLVISESEMGTVEVIPRTPKMNTPDPPPPRTVDYGSDDYYMQLFVQDAEINEKEYSNCLAGESQAIVEDLTEADCKELIIDCYAAFGNLNKPNINNNNNNNATNSTQVARKSTTTTSDANHDINDFCTGIGDLDGIELDTPPDFQLADLQFPSQDSVFDSLERL